MGAWEDYNCRIERRFYITGVGWVMEFRCFCPTDGLDEAVSQIVEPYTTEQLNDWVEHVINVVCPPVAHDTALSIVITYEVGNPIIKSVVGETVYIAGQLKDIVDNVALQNALITLYKNGVATNKTDVTDASGVYSIPYAITKADVPTVRFKTYFAGT